MDAWAFTYSKDARYATDGFYLANHEGETLLDITCHLDRSGLGGEIEIQVSGANAADRLGAAEKHLRKPLFWGGEERVTSDPGQSLGKPSPQEEIFISYTWNPPQKPGEKGIPPGYEKPFPCH